MINLQLLLLLAFVAVIATNPLESKKPSFYINPVCAKGMGFWCQNIINAKTCNAVDFCISAVWEKHYERKDSDVVCNDCKDWVKKARHFVEHEDKSNEVVRSLKWTCDLIPLKSLQATCEKIVDENVPELLKILESSMDPDAVCSKLFFCNNKEYDQVLLNHSSNSQKLLPFTCGQCRHIGAIIENKFSQTGQDDILENVLGLCGEISSYSDACSSVVIANSGDIRKGLSYLIKKDKICKVTASCDLHQHQKSGIVDIVPSNEEGDPNIPCKLCEQLALHLGELLITNTSEIEFKNMMIGFCHQMGQFSDECVVITDQYYGVVYNFLVDKLNASKMCSLIGICPSNISISSKPRAQLLPLVPGDISSVQDNTGSRAVEFNIRIQVDLSESSLTLFKDGAWCQTCDFFVHYFQQALGDHSTQDKIVELMKKSCMKLPTKIQGECRAMIELYGDAIISFLDQDLDPRYICPKIKMCPPNLTIDYLKNTAIDEKPTCPFCLMAMQEIHDVIESNKTKQNIENVVSKLCNHLSDKLMGQCKEFVKLYSEDVIELILADFSPQEACTFIKLCTDNKVDHKRAKIVRFDDFEDEDDKPVLVPNPQCMLCKEIVKIVEQRVINKKSKDEIRLELENSCDRPKKFSDKCKKFVDKYSDQIVDLIERELEPEEVCRELIFCVSLQDAESQDYDSGLEILMNASKEPAKEIEADPQCVICEFVMTKLEDEIKDKKVDDNIKNIVKNICTSLPPSVGKSCKMFVDYYFDMIIMLIATTKPSSICGELGLCNAQTYKDVMTVRKIENIQHNVFNCALCKGLVEFTDTIVEDQTADKKIMNFEEKVCVKYAGKFRTKCHDFAETYGLALINHLKDLTDSDQICYQINLCSWSEDIRMH